jgi:hypothetical protein
MAPFETALLPLRGLLLGQAAGAKAAFFRRARKQEVQKIKSVAFCRIWPKTAFEK